MGWRCDREDDDRTWDLVFRLIDEFAREWTARQARAVVGALQGWTQEQVATLWEPTVTQPTVANHLRAAHWDAIDAALELYERHFETRESDPVSG